jgi:Ca2+-binding EF-hand superfamily protein
MKMGPCLKLLIAAYVLSFFALAAAVVAPFMGGGAAAQGAGDAGATKQVDSGVPVRQEPPASTLVAVQAQESQNPLDKEQPKHHEQPKHEEPKHEEPKHQPEQHRQEEKAAQEQQAQAQKRAKVLAIDFEELKRKLPATKGDEAQKAQRFAMFDRIDVHSKGALDVAEVTAGLRDVLQVGDTVASLDAVIAKAFAKAAAAGQAAAGNADGEGAATVEKNEFRLLLLYVRQYFRVFQIFAAVDTTGDNRMALDEFRTAQPEFVAMGLKIADADATFHAIDADKSGIVDFHEFAMWALEQDGALSG